MAVNGILYRGSAAPGDVRQTAAGTANQVLHGTNPPAMSAVVEADITLADNTTNDTTTSKHGFAPKGTVGTTQFWRQDWTLSTPAGSGDVVGPASSVEKEIALFDGTTGKLLERATGTGFVKVTSGVYQTPSATVALASEVSGDLPFANLTQIAGLSVLGVTGSSTADVAAITAGTDGHVLTRVSSSSVVFAQPGFQLIEEQSPSGAATATFSSLGAFTHLELKWSARSDAVATSVVLNINFNGDTGSNYDRENTSAAAAVLAAGESLGQTTMQIGSVTAASGTAGMVGTGTLTIYDYRGTTFQKQATALSCLRRATTSGNTLLQSHALGWRDTSAITSIVLTLGSGNFVSGSKLSLYGLK